VLQFFSAPQIENLLKTLFSTKSTAAKSRDFGTPRKVVVTVSFSEDDCTNLLEVMPEVQAAPDNEVSECIYTILGYA
jgi:hypothetical protein